ncbi:MAG: PAS domain-containing sensor histidine kinase [Bacteroidetes bacterium]|nr:PAS domain-containing sensor histidine kinase [Bacteroidota bacterium]
MTDGSRSGNHPAIPAEVAETLRRIPMPVYLLDAHGRVLFTNDAVEESFGWPASTLSGGNVDVLSLFPEPFRSGLLARVREEGTIEEESERLMPDGILRPVRSRWHALQPPIGSAVILGIDEDLSERRLREQELQQARKLAKIGVLSEGIAHELRNPISYALSAAQLLDDARLPDDVRAQCIQTIATGLRKAGLIVENLLSLGKPKTQIERKTVDLDTAITEAEDAAAAHPSYRRVDITRSIPDADALVFGNHDMIVQVFHNIIINALNELTDGGSIEIRVRRQKDGTRVTISDSGPGVSEEQMRHLFDPFYTASASGTGTGLGLTLSYYIMKEHGGSIEVESRPGSGATFILSFPADPTTS